MYCHFQHEIEFLFTYNFKMFITCQPFLVYGVALVPAILYHQHHQDFQHTLYKNKGILY